MNMCLKKANLTTNVTWGPYSPTELDESSHDNTPTPGPAPAHIPTSDHAPANSRVAHDMSDNIPFDTLHYYIYEYNNEEVTDYSHVSMQDNTEVTEAKLVSLQSHPVQINIMTYGHKYVVES